MSHGPLKSSRIPTHSAFARRAHALRATATRPALHTAAHLEKLLGQERGELLSYLKGVHGDTWGSGWGLGFGIGIGDRDWGWVTGEGGESGGVGGTPHSTVLAPAAR